MGEIYKAAVGAFQSHREPFAGGIDRDAAEPAGVGTRSVTDAVLALLPEVRTDVEMFEEIWAA